MIGFIGTSLQLQSVTTAHTWNSFWTTSDESVWRISDWSLNLSNSESESESYVTSDGQSASLSWNKAPIWGLRPDFYYCQSVAGLSMWGDVSDERTGLSFTIAAGPRQRSHSRIRVLWDSWSYFTVSGSRLPFSSPPTTRRAAVEVFDPASTRDISRIHERTRFFNCHTARI
jgi:hypothetical protein